MKNRILGVVIALALLAGAAHAQNTPVPLTNTSGTVVVNTNFGNNYFSLLLAANVTSFSFTNSAAQNPTTVTIVFQQNGTGNFTVTGFASNIVNPPNVSLAANAITVAQLTYDALTAKWYTVPNGGPTMTDGELFIPATSAGCLATPTTLTIASPQLYVRAALNNTVYSVTSNAAAGSFEIDCDLAQALATRTTTGKGISITAINVLYGAQAATPTSIANATFSTLTYPAVGGAASGTVSSALATTVTPGMSHSTPTATTTGQCVNEGNVLTTPLTFTALIPRLTYAQVFNQTAASAMTVQVCGFQVLYTNTPI